MGVCVDLEQGEDNTPQDVVSIRRTSCRELFKVYHTWNLLHDLMVQFELIIIIIIFMIMIATAILFIIITVIVIIINISLFK